MQRSRVVSLFNVYWPHLVTRGWTRWEAVWSCSRCLCTSGSESPRTDPPRPWSGPPGASPTSASSRPWSSTLRDSSLSRLRTVTGLNPHSQQLTVDPASTRQLRTPDNQMVWGSVEENWTVSFSYHVLFTTLFMCKYLRVFRRWRWSAITAILEVGCNQRRAWHKMSLTPALDLGDNPGQGWHRQMNGTADLPSSLSLGVQQTE